MSESLVGSRVAVTRQNSGSDAYGARVAAAAPRAAGGVNAPAGTDTDRVISAFGSVRALRFSHVAAATGTADAELTASAVAAARMNGCITPPA
jgi:hypothetical protein